MRLMDYLGHHNQPLPPVIEPGRRGCILRYNHEKRIVKPAVNAPVVMTIAQRNLNRQEKNRAEILRLIGTGITRVRDLYTITKLSKGTIFNHLADLEKNGEVTIDKRTNPWTIKPPRKNRAKSKQAAANTRSA